MDFGTIYIKTIRRAFIEVVTVKGAKDTIDLAKASDYLQVEAVRAYDEVLSDCKDALGANMSDAVSRAVLNAACIAIATRAYRVGMGLEPN